MKIFILVLLLLCAAQYTYAAFPVAYAKTQQTDTVSTPKSQPPHPGWLRVKRTPFTALSAFGFLLTCASILLIGFLSFTTGWFDYGAQWLLAANAVAGFSIVMAVLGILHGEGHLARIMLFCSVFFFLLLLIFL